MGTIGMTKLKTLTCMAALAACLGACQTVPEKPEIGSAIAFQAEIDGCRKVTIDLYEQVASQEYLIVDRLRFIDRMFATADKDEYNLRSQNDEVFIREMPPGRYYVRAMTCNNKVPRQQFTYGGFDVVEGRTTYIGSLRVGRQSGRVLLDVDNEAEAAYAALQEDWPAAADKFGVLLMATFVPVTP